jgi:hypothetical protein
MTGISLHMQWPLTLADLEIIFVENIFWAYIYLIIHVYILQYMYKYNLVYFVAKNVKKIVQHWPRSPIKSVRPVANPTYGFSIYNCNASVVVGRIERFSK